MPADEAAIDYSYDRNSVLDKKSNYLMEMLKFLPDYKRKLYAGQSVTDADYSQYGMGEDGLPAFGAVAANSRAYYGAYGVTGLQFLTDNAADFQHLDGTQVANTPVNPLISQNLWSQAMSALADEERSYYELMMDGIDELSPQKAFSVLTAMLESRTRVSNTLAEIFGRPDQSAAQRVSVFDEWFAGNIDGKDADPAKTAFVQFFLNASQTFVAHILPMYGGSDEFYLSSADKTNAQGFMTALSAKVSQYISSLTTAADKAAASSIWSEWLHPTTMPSAAQNVDPEDTEWGKQIAETLKVEMNKIVNSNIANRISYRARYKVYKQEKEEYDEKVEEEEKEELREEKAAKQKQAEARALEEKMAAQNREGNKVRVKEKEPEKARQRAPVAAKPLAVQRQQVKQQQQTRAVATNNTAKAAPKTAAKTSAARPAAKITTAAPPVRVNAVAKTSNKTPAAVKPVFRVRRGASAAQQPQQTVQQAAPARMSTKKVLAVQSVRTSKGRKARRVRPRSRRVWGRPTVFKL
jgi:hypothetical protein